MIALFTSLRWPDLPALAPPRRASPAIRAASLRILALLAIPIFAFAPPATAQNEVTPTTVGARLDPQIFLAQPNYNLRLGPISFRASVNLQTSYNDNLQLNHTHPISDEIIAPTFTLGAFWQLSAVNSLRLDVTFGYLRYVNHQNLNPASSAFTISPDSALEYKVFIGQVELQLHDRFAFEQDATSQAALSNVSNTAFFNNDIGLEASWSASPYLHFELGYDHTDLIPANSGFSFEAYSEDQLTFSSRVQIQPYLAAGLEGSVASTRYRTDQRPDATSISLGPFFDLKVTPFTHIRVGAGYQLIDFSGNATSGFELVPGASSPAVVPGEVASENQNGLYFNAEIGNDLTKRISQTLSAGREANLGITSAASSDYYVRYNASWKANALLSLQGNLFLELGKTSGALNPEHYTQTGFDFSANFALSKKLNASLSYRLIHNSSDIETNTYIQNVVSLSLGYTF